MVTYGKALCGGLFPLSALVLSAEFYHRLPAWPQTALGSTFSCSPFARTLGVHVVERVAALLSSGEFKQRAAMFEAGLWALARHPSVLSVRGYGLAFAVDLDSSRTAARFVSIALDHGLLVYACGPHKNVVKLYPPDNVTDECTRLILARLQAVVAEVEQGGRRRGSRP